MHADTGILAVVGGAGMTLALVLAWCLAGVRSSRLVKRRIPNPQYLLKARLDVLMMTGLLFVLCVIAAVAGFKGSPWIIGAGLAAHGVGAAGALAWLLTRPDANVAGARA